MSPLSSLLSTQTTTARPSLDNYTRVASLHLINVIRLHRPQALLFTARNTNNSDLSLKHFIFHSFQVSQVGEVLRALGTNPTEGEVKKLITSTCTVRLSRYWLGLTELFQSSWLKDFPFLSLLDVLPLKC